MWKLVVSIAFNKNNKSLKIILPIVNKVLTKIHKLFHKITRVLSPKLRLRRNIK
jgi:hypothetical protein